jgi:hypothetical protein
VRLTVTAREGLVVVVPAGWRGDPGDIVDAKAAWARRALERVDDRRRVHAAGPAALLPERVELRAIAESLSVTYSDDPAAGPARVLRAADTLVLTGDPDAAGRIAALKRWLSRVARDALIPRAAQLASRHSLAPYTVRVSTARTRWGSCSARGTIALSRNLLFVEPRLVDALILHELAHLKHLDHSPRFHAFLASLDPQAPAHRRALREARDVPPWAES